MLGPMTYGVLSGSIGATGPSPLLDDLVAYWPMDEEDDSGTAITRVDSHGTHDAVDAGGVKSAPCIINNGVDYTGTVGHLDVADHADIRTGDRDWTFSLWARLNSKSADSYIISKARGTGGHVEFALRYLSSSDRFEFFVSPDGGYPNRVSVSANQLGSPAVDTWYFIVIWHDAVNDTINIQVNDGAVDSTAHSTGVDVGTSPLEMGVADQSANPLDGFMDEVGRWNRVLTAADRSNLYNEVNGLSYPFSSDPVTTITVASGGDINAAIEGMWPGQTLQLETGGSYSFVQDERGFEDLPSGAANRKTKVVGNGATISGGQNNVHLANKQYISFEDCNFENGQSWNALVTQSDHIDFTDCDFYNPATGTAFDCWRADNSEFVTLTRCTAHSTTNVDSPRAHDGFELWGPCSDFVFTDCVAYDIKNGATEGHGHGFEVFGQLAGELCERITFTNCESYNCKSGFTCEGGTAENAHVDVVCDGCSSHDHEFYGYQGVQGATLFRENVASGNNTGNGVSETNGSVTDLS